MASILITGGRGFIGAALAENLRAAGHAVRVLDNRTDAAGPGDPAGVEFVQGSVGDASVLATAFADIDRCVHLAGTPVLENPRAHLAEASAPFLAAVEPLFAAAARDGVPVIYASSAAVYGEAADLPIAETAPRHPVTAHGLEKLSLETCAAQYAERRALPSLGLRMFNVYGPGQNLASPYCGVVRRFADKVLNGGSAVIYGGGSHTRDFVYVDDVVDAFVGLLDIPLQGADVVNVCTGRATEIRDLAGILETVSGRSLDLRFEGDPETEVASSVGDPTKAGDRYGIEARVSIEEGAGRMVEALQSSAA